MLVIWIMQIFSTCTIAQYSASIGLSQIMKKRAQPIMYILMPIIYLIAMLPKDVNELFSFGDFIGNTSIGLFGILPVLLLLISIIFKKGAVKQDE
ncbi:Spore germination protein YndE [compost metagenome]